MNARDRGRIIHRLVSISQYSLYLQELAIDVRELPD